MTDIHDQQGKTNMHKHMTSISQNALSKNQNNSDALINSQLMPAVNCSVFRQTKHKLRSEEM